MGAVVMPRGKGGSSVTTGKASVALDNRTPTFDIPLTGTPSAVLVWIDSQQTWPVVLTQDCNSRTLMNVSDTLILGMAVASLDSAASRLTISRWRFDRPDYTLRDYSGTVYYVALG